MQFRSITPAEVTAFATIAGDAERSAAIAEMLGGYLAEEISSPRLMWVAEDGSQWLGRVAYTSNRGETTPDYLVWLETPPQEDDLAIASTLIQRSLREILAQVQAASPHEVEAILDAPGPFTADPIRGASLLTAGGFHLLVDRRRFEWTHNDPLPAAPTRLIFQTLDEVGEEAFTATMARIIEGTLDNYTQELAQSVGTLEAARRHFHEEQRNQKRWEPHWWQLGSLPTGEVVGVIMPAENIRWPNIGYIGVVPDQRGHGYSQDLLAQGTRTLIAEGAERIIADTDLGNTPMANTFLRMGYRQFAPRQFWKLTVDTVEPISSCMM
ncbi:MAG TPA: GNAT family N-acetyltransferase [Ktedonobacterales bacterium]|nr:GNAT family N-acetyltransferase [Ktedonobacterales bacterium]